MSVLSVFEIIFWIARFTFRRGNVKDETKNENKERCLEVKIQRMKSLRKGERNHNPRSKGSAFKAFTNTMA